MHGETVNKSLNSLMNILIFYTTGSLPFLSEAI